MTSGKEEFEKKRAVRETISKKSFLFAPFAD